MLHRYNIEEWAEKYYNRQLTQEEKAEIDTLLEADVVLQKEWDEAMELLAALAHASDAEHIRQALRSARQPEKAPGRLIAFIRNNWKTSAIAASFALAAISTVQYMNSSKEMGNSKSKFTQLSREVENIKNSQNSIIKTIEDKTLTPKAPEPQYDLGGTGFALTNDGYIATNYHVVTGTSDISIITQDNHTYNAVMVGYDAVLDLAILKITDKDFKFGKSPVPYNLKYQPSQVLGLKVFSVGYPQDNLVYNEGYISCERGYQGDSLSYQLEIVANPGQSGSPVIDKQGNVLGLINGKKSNTSGTTYAVRSKALLDLIGRLPDHIRITPPRSNAIARLERTEQVSQLKNYIVTIKTVK